MRDLLEFLLAAGVLSTTGAGDAALIQLSESAPLPGEVLSLSDDDRRADDELRWQRLHEPAAQALIDLFVPDEAATTTLRTSLQRLARQLDLAVESVRAGVLNLLNDGDFTASADVAADPRSPGLRADGRLGDVPQLTHHHRPQV